MIRGYLVGKGHCRLRNNIGKRVSGKRIHENQGPSLGLLTGKSPAGNFIDGFMDGGIFGDRGSSGEPLKSCQVGNNLLFAVLGLTSQASPSDLVEGMADASQGSLNERGFGGHLPDLRLWMMFKHQEEDSMLTSRKGLVLQTYV